MVHGLLDAVAEVITSPFLNRFVIYVSHSVEEMSIEPAEAPALAICNLIRFRFHVLQERNVSRMPVRFITANPIGVVMSGTGISSPHELRRTQRSAFTAAPVRQNGDLAWC
jgi:hypothetical protein